MQSDRAAEMVRNPDVATLIVDRANHVPRNAENVFIFVSFLNHSLILLFEQSGGISMVLANANKLTIMLIKKKIMTNFAIN